MIWMLGLEKWGLGDLCILVFLPVISILFLDYLSLGLSVLRENRALESLLGHLFLLNDQFTRVEACRFLLDLFTGKIVICIDNIEHWVGFPHVWLYRRINYDNRVFLSVSLHQCLTFISLAKLLVLAILSLVLVLCLFHYWEITDQHRLLSSYQVLIFLQVCVDFEDVYTWLFLLGQRWWSICESILVHSGRWVLISLWVWLFGALLTCILLIGLSL